MLRVVQNILKNVKIKICYFPGKLLGEKLLSLLFVVGNY